jgi:hypothetical protein
MAAPDKPDSIDPPAITDRFAIKPSRSTKRIQSDALTLCPKSSQNGSTSLNHMKGYMQQWGIIKRIQKQRDTSNPTTGMLASKAQLIITDVHKLTAGLFG